jgi:glycosyltransferase involved in cell wall biosynthesis
VISDMAYPTKPRVLHLTDSDVFGGAEQALLMLLTGLDRSRWDLMLAHHPSRGLAPLVEGVTALNIPTLTLPTMAPGYPGVRRIPNFVTALRRLGPSIVHLHLTWPLACQYALLGSWLARTPRIVATVHLYLNVEMNRRVAAQQRLITRVVDRYIAVSAHVRTKLVTELGWAPTKIDLVYNGVEVAADPPMPSPALRAALRGTGDRPLILVPARLTPQKGHRFLLEAATQLPDARVVLAGDGPERSELEALAHDRGLAEQVLFLGHREDVRDLLAVADVVVLPSLFEGFPLSLLEAMVAGTPVIATRIGGVDELVRDGCNGLLVEPQDPEALAAAIRRLLEDRGYRQQLATAAKADVTERFSSSTMCQRVGAIYDAVLPA